MKNRNQVWLTVFILFFSASLAAQESVSSVTAKLVGKSWVKYKEEGKMDSFNVPLTYVFKANKTVVISENGAQKTKRWKLEQDSNGLDIYIYVDTKKYTVTFFKDSKQKENMKLRDKADVKSSISTDHYFK